MERNLLRNFLRDMIRARVFEKRAAQEYKNGNIAGFLHLYPGEEAVAVGVLHAADASDYVVATYREHVHALVRGVSARAIMAELFGKKTGVSHGMGGSMHLFDKERRFLGGYAIVGETYPVAVGVGYAIALRKDRDAVICFFGDGAVNQGTFHESLNMAKLWNLPILFICENNRYQIGTEIHRHSAVVDVYHRASAYQIPAQQVNGMDVFEVYESTRRALENIHQGDGPQFIECQTYRYMGHSVADPGFYRPKVEVKEYEQMDPIEIFTRHITEYMPSDEEISQFGTDPIATLSGQGISLGHTTQAEVKKYRKEAEAELEDAVAFALQSPEPEMGDIKKFMRMGSDHEKII